MLPYARIALKLFFSGGQNAIHDFLKKYYICPPDNKLFVSFFSRVLSILDVEEIDYLKKKPFHLRLKKGPTAKNILKKVNFSFGCQITPKPKPFMSKNLLRIVENRELRIFIDVLLLGRCDLDAIILGIEQRFRLNKDLSSEDIEEYVYWFFDPRLMDDKDWQEYLISMKSWVGDFETDAIYKDELNDKVFSFRAREEDVLVRMGVRGYMNYIDMLESIASHTYEQIQRDMNSNIDFKEIERKIKIFQGLGSEFHKNHKPDSGKGLFETATNEVINQCIEALPIFDKDSGQILDPKKSDCVDDEEDVIDVVEKTASVVKVVEGEF